MTGRPVRVERGSVRRRIGRFGRFGLDRGLGRGLAPPARVDERGRDRRDIGVALAFDGGRPQRGGRVVHGKDQRGGGARRRIDRPDGAVRLRDPRARHERAHRVPPERHHDSRVEDLELAPQVRRAGRDLVRLRVTVLGRPALDHVGDEHVLAPPADRGEELDQEVAGAAHEWPALPILVEARALADEDDLGLGVALARDGLRPRLVETAVRARSDLGGDRLERHPALDVGHAVASAASWLSVAPGARYGLAPRDAAGRIQSRSTEDLGDLDGVRGSPLAQVVRDDPERDAAIVGDGDVPPDATDEDLVAAGGLGRQRVAMLGGVVLDDDAGHGGEERTRSFRRDRLARLDVDRLGVAHEDRDPNRRARDAQLGQAEDLAVLADDLPFLLGVAVVEEDVDLGQRVERDRVRVHAGDRGLARDVGADLGLELGQRVGAGARHGLVGVDHDPLEADRVAERHQDGRHLHRGAVRVGDDARVAFEVARVDLRDDERDRRVHPPGRRVVDDRRATGDGSRRELLRDVGAGREQGDIDTVEGIGHRLGDLERATVDRHGPAGRSTGREQSQLTDRELPLVEDLDHRPSDDAGSSDDGDGEGVKVHGTARLRSSCRRVGHGRKYSSGPPATRA